MSPALVASAMVLTSGAAHAVVNAILKGGGDKLSSRALIDGFSALIVAPFVVFVPLPVHAWGWLAGSVATHLVYLICLVRAFEAADMSAAYPIARGVAPALTATLAVAIFREAINPVIVAGVALVSVGVLVVGLGRNIHPKGVAWAAACGAMVALYTVIDAQGVRAAPTAPSYIVWTFLADGVGIGGLFAIWRGPTFLLTARNQWKPGLIAGGLSIVSYGLALWAFRLGATPRLAALRECSILFGVAIAVVFLKEKVSAPRLAGVATIAAGAVALLVSG